MFIALALHQTTVIRVGEFDSSYDRYRAASYPSLY